MFRQTVVNLTAILLTFFIIYPAMAEEQIPNEQQQGAVMFEWVVANCGLDGVSAIYALVAPSIINGSDPELIQNARNSFREYVENNFENQEAACRILKPEFKVK